LMVVSWPIWILTASSLCTAIVGKTELEIIYIVSIFHEKKKKKTANRFGTT